MQVLSPQPDFDDGPDLQFVGEKPDRLASICRDVGAVIGGSLITVGVCFIHMPAALIVGGTLILIGVIVGAHRA